MMFPDVVKKGSKALGSTVSDRLPKSEDLEDLPYVRCIMKEVWRVGFFRLFSYE